jgi:hypothetical protein
MCGLWGEGETEAAVGGGPNVCGIGTPINGFAPKNAGPAETKREEILTRAKE